MLDKVKHLDTGKKSSSGSNRDLIKKHYEERSESQPRDAKRNSATSSSQEVRKSKASSSDPARAGDKRNSATSSSQEAKRSNASSSDLARRLDRLRISQRTDHQRTYQWPTGTKFSREISRATSSSFSGRDARGQRKHDPLLRTQGRQLRGGGGPDDTSDQQGESNKRFKHSDGSAFKSYDKGDTSNQRQEDKNEQQDDQQAEALHLVLTNWKNLRENDPGVQQYYKDKDKNS